MTVVNDGPSETAASSATSRGSSRAARPRRSASGDARKRRQSRSQSRGLTREPWPARRGKGQARFFALLSGALLLPFRFAGRILSKPSEETWGLLVLAASILAALGLWAHHLGNGGVDLDSACALALGNSRWLIPLWMLGVSIGLVRRADSGRIVAMAASGFLVLVAVGGLWATFSAHAGLNDGSGHWRQTGGFFGAIVGGGLRSEIGVPGSAVVLVVVAILALFTYLGVPLGQVVSAVLSRSAGQNQSKTKSRGAGRSRASSRRASLHAPLDEEPSELAGRRQSPLDQVGSGGKRGLEPGGGELFDAEEVLGDLKLAEASPSQVQGSPNSEAAAEADGAAGGEDLAAESPRSEDLVSLESAPATRRQWALPPASLLSVGRAQRGDRSLVEARGKVLEKALAAHGVETRLVGFTAGPTVTRYELELGPGVKVAKVTSLHKDIAYAMASPDVRIIAPIPGRSAIGVEVPNAHRQIVTLGELLRSEEARGHSSPLEVAMGRDIAGRPVFVNLAEMPHLLIAGATGSGKSSCINSLLVSILMRSTPAEVRMILVDPKRVELGHYNGLPHLLAPVVVNPKKAANALAWAVREMERRYDLLAEAGVRDIKGYNEAAGRGELGAPDAKAEPLPYVLVVVDELNDLMMVAARDVEDAICRIAQMARAVGIHLVIATQRPSVDVITGVIKANIPSRMAFSVSSQADSRVILDQVGAERLVGKGDMLLLTASSSVARRLQAPWVSESEISAVVAHWRRQARPSYQDEVVGEGEEGGSGSDDSADDELFQEAMELVVRSQLGSTSMLQRKLRIGFARAGRLMDLLERRGVVGPAEGSKPRSVLMTVEELEQTMQRSRSHGG